jgi:hypothetical protein
MSLRIYWRSGTSRSGRARRCVVELVIAAALVTPVAALAKKAGPAPAEVVTPEVVTAREAVERQFAAPAMRAPEMSGAEAARIMEKYHARIGKMLEPKREIGGGRADQ